MTSKDIKDYFKYCREFAEEYGKNTVIFIEVGSFMEIYGLDLKTRKEGVVEQVTKILNIAMTRKNKKNPHSTSNPLMAGITSPHFYKYVPMLLSAGYTVVEIRQVTPPPLPRREVTEIHSPGISLNPVGGSIQSNFLLTILIDFVPGYKNKPSFYSYGMSQIDVSTGETIVYQTCEQKQLEQHINACNYKEIALYFFQEDIQANSPKFLNFGSSLTHRYELDSNYTKATYRDEFLRGFFPSTGVLNPTEWLGLEKHEYGCIAFCCMMQFVNKHNPKLCQTMFPPKLISDNRLLKLDASSLQQLQIVPDKNIKILQHGIRGLTDLLDFSCTAPGKRFLYQRLTSPIRDPEILQQRYDQVEKITNTTNIKKNEKLRDHLKNVYDLERIHRKMAIQLLTPGQFINADKSYQHILSAMKIIDKIKITFEIELKSTMANLQEFRKEYLDVFDLSKMEGFGLNDINQCFFLPGKQPHIEKLQETDMDIDIKLNELSDEVQSYIPGAQVYLKHNDRDGYYLATTTKRSKILTDNWAEQPYQIKKQNTVAKLFSPELKRLSDQKVILQEKLKSEMRKAYLETIKELYTKYSDCLNEVQQLLSEIDATQAISYAAIKFKYCKPTLLTGEKGQLMIKGLRHPIIEQIQTAQEYIPNDIELGENNNHSGMLLYGCNSSGKSSLMKAIGVATIMAQAGCFVPANSFSFTPFDQLFTRISGDDDLLQGHSSFVVEMLEVRDILEKATSNSLVLSDELSRGTEETSGTAIVSSVICNLADRDIVFCSATHLHRLPGLDEIAKRKRIGHFHLEVKTHPTEDTLIYNRILQPGSGDPIYGLRIARHIIRDSAFIELADKIQTQLQKPIELKKSRYNNDFFLGRCEICDKPAEDCHHIKHQCTADNAGYIGLYHKNKRHNLVALCKICHQKTHKNIIEIEGWVQTENGKRLSWLKKD